ncbi:alpha/beta hydrolase [Cyanobium sp. WAJ14-Wanaka]|uniref:alpha/beta hydrolase n=1 Tax=Cyanobium sp. WAJ14-Wanaka TaxID=2823725 RepID=UPI0029F1E5D2|nr:alpha/beta hydrolase [Cyanobium sp. WAJ14-Wanaka]
MSSLNKRRALFAAAAALGLAVGSPAGLAAENLVFVSGAFRRSIPVAELEHLAQTGQAVGLTADVLAISKQKPAEVAKMLNQSLSMPVTLVSRLLNTRIGEAILARLAKVVYPLKASQEGVLALRAAVIIAIANGNGSINAISFLKAYPVAEMEVSIPALMAALKKARSLAELVRFFSESPLDGLKPAP